MGCGCKMVLSFWERREKARRRERGRRGILVPRCIDKAVIPSLM